MPDLGPEEFDLFTMSYKGGQIEDILKEQRAFEIGQFCDLGTPKLPRAIRYYIILVIGREGKGQSPLMASGDFRGIKAN